MPSETDHGEDPSANDIVVAKRLLFQNPIVSAQALKAANEELLGLVWVVWLDRAEDLSRFAGNTRLSELFARGILSAAVGIALVWIFSGFPFAWFGTLLAIVVGIRWWIRRRFWHKSVVVHIIWGSVISAEFKERFHEHKNETHEALSKIDSNVHKFITNYEKWIGRPLARQVG